MIHLLPEDMTSVTSGYKVFPVVQKPIIVLVDAVSSGRHLKENVIRRGYDLILINTLTQTQLKNSGKDKGREIAALEEFYISDMDDVELLLRPYRERIKAIIAASEPGVEVADRLAFGFGLPGNLPATTARRRNKYEMREALKGSDQLVNYRCCKTTAEVADFLDQQALPIVVKAVSSAGSDHVYFCHDREVALQTAAVALGSFTLFGEQIREVLVEEFIKGELLIAEFFVSGGQLLVTSLWTFEMHEVTGTYNRIFRNAWRHSADSPHFNEVHRITTEIASRTGLMIGPGLIELKFDLDTHAYKLIEIGSRLSGIELPVIQRETTSFDPYEQLLDCYLSPSFQLPEKVDLYDHAELYFISVQASGQLEGIEGLELIRQLPSFYFEKVMVKPDTYVEQTKDQVTLAAIFYLIHPDNAQIQEDKEVIDTLFKLIYQ